MNWRRSIGWFGAVLAVVAFIGGGAAGAAHAAPAPRSAANVAAFGIPHEASKVILPDTSFDGPALWTQRGPSAPVGPAGVLAWTGTDGRLNFEFTNDGVQFFGKKTVNEYSAVHPAVVRGTGEGGFDAPVALAWMGTDSGHRLNVLYAVTGSPTLKLTLWQDNTFTSPALEWLDNKTLLLVWAGTDRGHALNILPITVSSQALTPGAKIILWNYHSAAQPAIINDGSVLPTEPRMFLSWTDMTSQRITFATSPDSKTWTLQPAFAEWSGAGPSMMGLNERLDFMPPYWLGWTGLDSAHHVNVLYALDFNHWTTSNVKATLPELATGGTAIGFVLSPPDQQMLVAWTGTDAAHHLNVARIAV